MIEIRPSKASELPAQKALWQTCFGDDGAFIDLFYARYCAPEGVLVLAEDGVLRSMAAILPMGLRFPDGTAGRAGYVYALSTDPDARGRGFARELLNYADFYLRNRGADCVITVPATESLHGFFASAGYEACFSHRRSEVTPGALPPTRADDAVTPADPADYGRIRERLLEGRFHVSYGEPLLSFQSEGSRMFGGDLCRVTVDGTEGCAAVEAAFHGRFLVKELLIPAPCLTRAAAAVLHAFGASSCQLRTPVFLEGLPGGLAQPFGRIKWYDPRLRRSCSGPEAGYLGLGFD